MLYLYVLRVAYAGGVGVREMCVPINKALPSKTGGRRRQGPHRLSLMLLHEVRVGLVSDRECLEYLNKIEYFLILGIQDLNIF